MCDDCGARVATEKYEIADTGDSMDLCLTCLPLWQAGGVTVAFGKGE